MRAAETFDMINQDTDPQAAETSAWNLPGLTEEDRLVLSGLEEARFFAPAEAIIRCGEYPRALFLIMEGAASVRVRHGGADEGAEEAVSEVARVEGGSLLGELSFVSGDPASADVVALSSCRVARVAAQSIERHGRGDPGFIVRLNQSLTRVIGERLRRMNTSRATESTFAAPAWSGTLAEIQGIVLPPIVMEHVMRYEEVAHRGIFLWKWCWRGLEETTLRSVPNHLRNELLSTKLLGVILNVLMDDLADHAGNESRFERAAAALVPHRDLLAGMRMPEPADAYEALIFDLWRLIGLRASALSGWQWISLLWDFDYRQVFNTMRYAMLARLFPGMDNLVEHRAYLGHNMNMMPFATLDLMASSPDPYDVGIVREAVYHAQNWGQIGNMLATWRREAPDRDFSSRIFVLAVDRRVVTPEELVTLPADELIARVDVAGLETALMQECEAHRRRLAELAASCRSLDLHAFARGVESLFAQSLAARGFI